MGPGPGSQRHQQGNASAGPLGASNRGNIGESWGLGKKPDSFFCPAAHVPSTMIPARVIRFLFPLLAPRPWQDVVSFQILRGPSISDCAHGCRTVTPAKAGDQDLAGLRRLMDPGIHRNPSCWLPPAPRPTKINHRSHSQRGKESLNQAEPTPEIPRRSALRNDRL